MKDLKQLIRESINEYIRGIDEAGENAALEAKMNKTQEAIELREKKMKMEGLDEAYHDMLDKTKMKELGGEVKALKKSLDKLGKQLEKLNSKGTKTEKPESEEKEEIIDETMIDEGETAEKLFKMFKKQNLLNDRREYDAEDFMSSYPELSKDEAEKLENMLQNPDNLSELDDMDIYEVLHMQKLAGIISETEYVDKMEKIKKKLPARKAKSMSKK